MAQREGKLCSEALKTCHHVRHNDTPTPPIGLESTTQGRSSSFCLHHSSFNRPSRPDSEPRFNAPLKSKFLSEVEKVTYYGTHIRVQLNCGGQRMMAQVALQPLELGEPLWLSFDPGDAHVMG